MGRAAGADALVDVQWQMTEIVRDVSRETGVPVDAILDRRRGRRRVAQARQDAYLACRERCPAATLVRIGQFFRRDHSTVLYGICAAAERRRAARRPDNA